MVKWETEIIRGNIGETVRSEYQKLLSVNKSGEEAEGILINHFQPRILADTPAEGSFWMALGLCEWQSGRLTQTAKENAKKWAVSSRDDISLSARQALLNTLDMPMPPRKRIRMPSHVSHCPWPAGSLLAYRIISSNHPHVTQSPFFGKYVLLRIIKIKRIPITDLAPNDGWDERMLVGLYHWIGDSVPHPDIVHNLEYTAISVEEPAFDASVLQRFQIPHLSAEMNDQLQQLIPNITAQRIETCCDLEWKCPKGLSRDDVFTYLAHDPSYEDNIPPYFKANITDYSMCYSIPFDAVLVNRFSQLTEQPSK